MSVTAKVLINTQFASASLTSVYTVPAGTTTIIDKFTAANSNASSEVLAINIVPALPAGTVLGNGNAIVLSQTLTTNSIADVTVMQNQILAAGDQVFVSGGAISSIAIRMSGREIT